MAYVNGKDIGGNPVRYELQQHRNWQGDVYYCLIDAYYLNGERICENLRSFKDYRTITDGLDALERVSGTKFTPEFRSTVLDQTITIMETKNMMYTGEKAKSILTDILSSLDGDQYPMHDDATGYFLDESGVYVAFDNTTCDCWVEEFDSVEKAINWIENGNE